MATGTAPREWWEEDDAVLATIVDLLEERSRSHG